ncbi:MAG: hypothetical protein HUJ25_08680 [Crocinitomicaceae bacterium]|nr:hypothetical protein [Crocinitomicaceae bacterium]
MVSKDNQHIALIVQESLQKYLNFEVFQEILNSCSFNMEQYLQISNKIKEFVFLIFESYISDTKANRGSVMELTEIKEMLNYRDLRSVLKWCAKNAVFVFNQGNMQLVNRSEFLLAYHKPFIIHLQERCENWQEEFLKYVHGDLEGLVKNSKKNAPVPSYIPRSKVEKSFLNKMKKL